MSQTGAGVLVRPGSWLSISLIYVYGVMTSASLSKAIPAVGDVAVHLGASADQFGLIIALFTAAPAVLASVAGSVIDRIGARTAMLIAAGVGVVTNLAYLFCTSLAAFMLVRVLEGFIAIGIYSAAPALIMATTGPARRGRAMAFWSTYTPVGFSVGLVLAGAFAGTANWRGGYLVHMLLFALLVPAGLLLPRVAPQAAARSVAGLFSAWTQSGPLRLALCFSMLVMAGFGTSTVFPEWYARQHGVSVGQASSLLGVINLVMIPGGLIAGWALARGWRDLRLFCLLMLLAVLVSVPLFMPGVTDPARALAMIAWMLVQGAAIAAVTAALPHVVANPMQGAAAAGLLSQLAAMVTFVTPLLWQPFLLSGRWHGFVVLVLGSSLAACLIFPRRVPAVP